MSLSKILFVILIIAVIAFSLVACGVIFAMVEIDKMANEEALRECGDLIE